MDFKGGDILLIQADIDVEKGLSTNDILALIDRHSKEITRIRRLNNYYVGNQDIMQKRRDNGAANNIIINNFCAYITDMSTGFFIGKPISYTSNNEKALETINEVFKYNDEADHNLRLAEAASICGYAYELLYMDEEARVRFTTLNPEEVILVADTTVEKNIRFAIRHYDITSIDGNTDTTYIEVYDETNVVKYRSSGTLVQVEPPTAHRFDGVPIIEYPNNNKYRGDFEGVMSLVDAYNKTQSFNLDDMEDFTNAYLVLKGFGYAGGDKEGRNEDIRQMRQNKVLLIDEDGGAEWLIKNINDTYIENMKNRLKSDIHKFSNVPDMTDENFSANASGVAIKYKLIGLEQIRSRKERLFKKAIQRRVELIFGVMGLTGDQYDFRDIEPNFSDNVPANVKELADIVKELYGIVSNGKLLSLLPFITDPQDELDAIQKENEDSLNNNSDLASDNTDKTSSDGEDNDTE